jgi:excisionase family DNA binding protein
VAVTDLLTTTDAAAYLGLSPTSLRRLVATEVLPRYAGRWNGWRFSRADLDEYRESTRGTGSTQRRRALPRVELRDEVRLSMRNVTYRGRKVLQRKAV